MDTEVLGNYSLTYEQCQLTSSLCSLTLDNVN